MKAPCPTSPDHLTSSFSSIQRIYCHDCREHYDWPLNEDQAPLVTNNRDTRGSKQ